MKTIDSSKFKLQLSDWLSPKIIAVCFGFSSNLFLYFPSHFLLIHLYSVSFGLPVVVFSRPKSICF